jgi:hypothetical protein
MKLSKSQYYDYIRSDLWKEKKKQYYSSKLYKTLRQNNKGWVCYCCGVDNRPLDLHHRTYKRLGEENIAVDLVPVCRECHDKIHHYHKNNAVSLWTATKKIRVGPKKNKVVKKKKTKEQVLAIQQKKTKKRLERKLKKLQPAPENKF